MYLAGVYGTIMLFLLKKMVVADIPWFRYLTVDYDTFLEKALLFCWSLPKQMNCKINDMLKKHLFWILLGKEFLIEELLCISIWGCKCKKLPKLTPNPTDYLNSLKYKRILNFSLDFVDSLISFVRILYKIVVLT